jgi:hypothetical protein
MFHGKSGRNNTGDDNGLLLWCSIADYVMESTKCEPSDVDNYFSALINGDDSVCAWYEPCSAQGWRQHCKQFNLQIELEDEKPRYAVDTTFLSHHLKERFIPKLGDCVVAAGNLPKLVSSIEWIRRNDDFSDEENALVHLLGLRINLWPWKYEFDELELLLDKYISSLTSTPRIRNMLKARISEQQIMGLHFRFEEVILTTLGEMQELEYCVRDSIISAIFEASSQMAGKHTQEMARRLAQSKKDKKMQAAKPKLKGGVKLNSSGPALKKFTAPAAIGFESQSKFKEGRSTKFKDGIVVEGNDHLEFVIVPAVGEVTGGVLNEIYINPLEFGGTRLEKFGTIYEKYLFDLLEFEYVPAVGSDVGGDILLAYDRDIDDPTPPPTEGGLKQFTSFEDAKDGNVWNPHRIKCRLTQPDAGYYTNPTPGGDRFAYQGQFYVVTVVPTGVPNKTLGRIRMHFRCHFFTPQLDNASANANMAAPTGPGPAGTFDFFAPSANSSSQPNGNPAFKPKLDSNAKAYIDLAQGIYKLYQNIAGGSTTLASAVELLEFGATSLVPNEPMPATAPQPWIETIDSNTEQQGAGEAIQSLSQLLNLGVPRGGAKLYSEWLNNGATTGAALNVLWELSRVSGYNSTPSGLFLARWQGVEECKNPYSRTNFKKATARAKHPTKWLAAVHSLKDDNISRELAMKMEVCNDGCAEDHRRTSPTDEEVAELRAQLEALKRMHMVSFPSSALAGPPTKTVSNTSPFGANDRR